MIPLTDRERNIITELMDDSTNSSLLETTYQEKIEQQPACIFAEYSPRQHLESSQSLFDDSDYDHSERHAEIQEDLQKLERLNDFKEKHQFYKDSGMLDCQLLKDSHECLQRKELIDNTRKFCETYKENGTECAAVRNPLRGHKITKEFRTKMNDWMVEVCSSFKCQPRTYFLSSTILDKYFTACH